jgi:membrane protein DedA with SNARE-associated domain
VLESLTEFVSASPWTYAAIVGLVAADALLPLLPSETALISAGVLAGSGDLSLLLVVAAGAAGALAGDNAAYSLGRVFGGRFAGRRRDWAGQKLENGGTSLLVVARFVPGGRTAATITSGLVRYRWSRFVMASVVGGLLWASSATLVGYGGGRVLQEHPLLLIPIVLGAAAAYLAIKRLRRRAGNRLVMPPIRPVARTKRLPA